MKVAQGPCKTRTRGQRNALRTPRTCKPDMGPSNGGLIYLLSSNPSKARHNNEHPPPAIVPPSPHIYVLSLR